MWVWAKDRDLRVNTNGLKTRRLGSISDRVSVDRKKWLQDGALGHQVLKVTGGSGKWENLVEGS